MQSQGDFKLCASSNDVVKRFAVIKSVVIKRVHCIYGFKGKLIKKRATLEPLFTIFLFHFTHYFAHFLGYV